MKIFAVGLYVRKIEFTGITCSRRWGSVLIVTNHGPTSQQRDHRPQTAAQSHTKTRRTGHGRIYKYKKKTRLLNAQKLRLGLLRRGKARVFHVNRFCQDLRTQKMKITRVHSTRIG